MLFALATFGWTPLAAAQDVAAAEALFREARTLLESGQLDAACPKFAESQRLDPSPGTLLNLAACYEKQGKTASAWAQFLAAARLASTRGQAERSDEARRKAADLEPGLSTLAVVVSKPNEGLVVRRGEVILEASSLGSRIPTDPGKHVITVSAPGYESLTLEITVGPSRDAQTLTVPALVPAPAPVEGAEQDAPPERAPAPVPETTAAPPEGDDGSRQRTIGFVIGGVGVAGLALGGVFGGLALASYSDAEGQCPERRNCDAGAMDARASADTQANVSNVGFGVGIVGVGVGLALVLTAGGDAAAAAPSSDTALRVTPRIESGYQGAAVSGAF